MAEQTVLDRAATAGGEDRGEAAPQSRFPSLFSSSWQGPGYLLWAPISRHRPYHSEVLSTLSGRIEGDDSAVAPKRPAAFSKCGCAKGMKSRGAM